MSNNNTLGYKPSDHEAEKASNSYLMSLIAIMAGLPLPIINLVATFIFYLGNRKGSYYTRWHCTQALVSQLSLVFINSASFYWTMSILFGKNDFTNNYFAYIITVIVFNVSDFIATINSAVKTRKGAHIEWWFYGPFTHLICKP